ncbi:thioesterase family protein [Bacteroides heparinolyticus]|uniref:thioesterase family protein n=1 Tax=Prevotella heparinolytica TaxID=28113 RepID=UPI0035A1C854
METGLTYTATTIVATENTALSLGSGDMKVFATPAMIALMENAAMNAVAQHLPEGNTTVGISMQSTHIAASGIGKKITATATLTHVEGRKLTFKVVAYDGETLIGEGCHERFIVDRERFLSKL